MTTTNAKPTYIQANTFFQRSLRRIAAVSRPLLKHSIKLALFTLLLLPLTAKAQTPVFPGPPLVGLLANRPVGCGTLLQEYFATDNSTLYYATVTGGTCTWVAVPVGNSSILLQVNGTNSGSQTKLNLAAGSNATITDGGSGTVTIAATAGGGMTTPGGAGNTVQFNSSSTFGGVTLNATATKEYLQQVSSGAPTFAQVAAADISGLAASATSDTTVASNITSGTLPAARLPNPSASTLGGIESLAAVTHNWIRSISTSGVPAASQPACGDLSDAAPSCNTDTTNAANISSGALPAARLPVPTASTLGGVESLVAVSHNWINTISTAGVPSATRPSAADLSDTATAGNYLRGNGTSFVSAAIQAGDVPTLNQNTTGTAANLSGTPALPNGTTATTQSPGDNSTNLATTAYADAEAAVQNPLTTIGDVWGGGAAGIPARIAGGLTGQSLTANNGSASAFASPGVAGRTVSGTTDTILCDDPSVSKTTRDRAATIVYTSASSVAVTLPQAGSTGCSSNFVFAIFVTGAGSVTVTPTTSTINGQATLVAIQNTWCSISSPDNTNYVARCANYIKAGTGITPTANADGSTTFALATNVIPTLIEKASSNTGTNYGTTSTSLVAVDATNLLYTVTIPSGSKLTVMVSGSGYNDTATDSLLVALAGASCASPLQTVFIYSAVNFQSMPFSLNKVIIGDGASHTVELCFAAHTGGTGSIINNSTAGVGVIMDFRLEAAN